MSDPVEILANVIDEAQRTLADEREPPPEAQALTGLAIRMRKLRRAWARPQAIGVFGPSQAGKSFLIGALLEHELGTLEVRARDTAVDFLEEINPAKGVESTGVVTRFSSGPAPSPLRRGDFYCRLLGLEVVLEAMATGFLVECTSPPIDVERVERVLREARLQGGPPAPERFRTAWDTVWHNLLKKYQDRHAYLNELRASPALASEQWKKSVTTVAGWSMVYSLLWGGHGYAKDLDQLMHVLLQGLELVGHAEAVEVYLSNVRASSDGASIIDAACLNSIGERRDVIRVFDQGSGRELAVDPGVLSALIAEIRLPLAPVPGSLLDNTDILDFPGGRALRGINGFGPDELGTGKLEHAIEVYKRGKLTFLFEQFALDREITALVLCSPGPTKPEAIQLQSQVERWLQIRHNAPSPTEREEIEQPSLFMALTKFDMSLGALRSDNARDRWDSRVREACVDFWARGHGSWILNWGGKGRPFTNMFWTRNPHADQMLTLEPGQPDYEQIRAGYLSSPAVQRFIGDAPGKWQALEGRDDDGLPRSGLPLLASHVRAKMAEDIKARELRAELLAVHTELVGILRALTPSKDEAEERARLRENAETLIAAVRREMARSYSGAVFGAFVDHLTAPVHEVEAEVRSIHAVVAPMSIKTSDKVKKILVHVLKWWVARGVSRFGDSTLALPAAHVERFVREVCQSKLMMPVLGKAIFPYFARTQVDFPLVASVLQVKICDAMLGLFVDRDRGTPAMPIRLSYSEVIDAGEAESADTVDWSDVDFDDEPSDSTVDDVELVFAGRRYFEAWSRNLGAFYIRNSGARVKAAEDAPLIQALQAMLRQVEGLDVRAAG